MAGVDQAFDAILEYRLLGAVLVLSIVVNGVLFKALLKSLEARIVDVGTMAAALEGSTRTSEAIAAASSDQVRATDAIAAAVASCVAQMGEVRSDLLKVELAMRERRAP